MYSFPKNDSRKEPTVNVRGGQAYSADINQTYN